jgi:NAD(P)-dependent dehydrogenase (short-subunit alcohol dehydrogenase family)
MTTGVRDRVALITGGAGNLGRHVVQGFLREGARVHVPTFDEAEVERLLTTLGGDADRVHVHPETDLSKPSDVARVLERVRAVERRGPQILLNLAGGFAAGPIEETEPDTWDRMMRINATTAYLSSRAAFPHMKELGWGRIVNVSALPALDRGKPHLAAYGAAKAAVLNLTHTLAKEGAEHGITANAILPSIIDTPENREASPGADTSTWLPPQRIADVLLFLASEAAGIVNGAAIPLTLSG